MKRQLATVFVLTAALLTAAPSAIAPAANAAGFKFTTRQERQNDVVIYRGGEVEGFKASQRNR